MSRVGILIIATGKYIDFFYQLYDSLEKNFLVDQQKTYYLFTDTTEPNLKRTKNVKLVNIERKGFPGDTMYRYHYFLTIESLLLKENKEEYLFYLDADSKVVDNVQLSELGKLSTDTPLMATSHPYFYLLNKDSCEHRPTSSCYVHPSEPRHHYVCGGFNGGRAVEYLTMAKEISSLIDRDQGRGITPVWHDESALNRYYVSNETLFTVLTPMYMMPESNRKNPFILDMHAKILALDKNKDVVRAPVSLPPQEVIEFDEIKDSKNNEKQKMTKKIEVVQKGLDSHTKVDGTIRESRGKIMQFQHGDDIKIKENESSSALALIDRLKKPSPNGSLFVFIGHPSDDNFVDCQALLKMGWHGIVGRPKNWRVKDEKKSDYPTTTKLLFQIEIDLMEETSADKTGGQAKINVPFVNNLVARSPFKNQKINVLFLEAGTMNWHILASLKNTPPIDLCIVDLHDSHPNPKYSKLIPKRVLLTQAQPQGNSLSMFVFTAGEKQFEPLFLQKKKLYLIHQDLLIDDAKNNKYRMNMSKMPLEDLCSSWLSSSS